MISENMDLEPTRTFLSINFHIYRRCNIPHYTYVRTQTHTYVMIIFSWFARRVIQLKILYFSSNMFDIKSFQLKIAIDNNISFRKSISYRFQIGNY